MNKPVPAVYARAGRSPLLSRQGRAVAAIVGTACLSVLMIAAYLTPNPHGTGSHLALGLQSCQFLERTGLPCPSCGMTTSFAWFARANVPASIWVQPFGFLLALTTAATFWIALYVSITGSAVYRLLHIIPAGYYLLPLFMLAIAAWGWKMFIHVRGLDGW